MVSSTSAVVLTAPDHLFWSVQHIYSQSYCFMQRKERFFHLGPAPLLAAGFPARAGRAGSCAMEGGHSSAATTPRLHEDISTSCFF